MAPEADALRSRLERATPSLWLELRGKLGERHDAFFEAVGRQAAKRRLAGDAAIARYAHLCCAFGPAFEERPENEWALAILADERLAEWLRLHQLVQRAARELKRRGGDADGLQRADAALLDALDDERHAADADAEPLARVACDLDALELRVLDGEWRHEYRKLDGSWQRVPGPPLPAPVRVDAAHPAPAAITVLSHADGDGPLARLQVRQILHGGCGERHPAVRRLDTRGIARWHGHEARALSWPVQAMRQAPPPVGLGVALVAETAPAVDLVGVSSCGMRDEGLAIGDVQAAVHVLPADQWLFALQRAEGAELAWPRAASAAAPPAATRCRIERDGEPLDAAGWVRGFDDTLPRALAAGFDALFASWQQAAREAAMRVTPGLLTGQAALAWGWREGAAGLADAPLMRVQAELRLACRIDLALEGELESAGTRARVRLAARGDAALDVAFERDRPQPPLLDTLLPATLRLRAPFELAFDPLASDDGTVWSEAGPCSGALVAEAGLRPRQGGSGWQWFVRMQLEPVLAPVVVHDPVLGRTRRALALLPALPLVDWSLG
ncbi:MAG: hypothetical protein ACJ8G7_04155 [Rhizobacter sp.]